MRLGETTVSYEEKRYYRVFIQKPENKFDRN